MTSKTTSSFSLFLSIIISVTSLVDTTTLLLMGDSLSLTWFVYLICFVFLTVLTSCYSLVIQLQPFWILTLKYQYVTPTSIPCCRVWRLMIFCVKRTWTIILFRILVTSDELEVFQICFLGYNGVVHMGVDRGASRDFSLQNFSQMHFYTA